MTLKPPGPHLEASVRIQAVYDMAAAVSINPTTHPKHYLRSGRELIRSAASYQEDGQIEHAYILYIRFLTIFVGKLRSHPNFKEVPSAERKIMSDYCNKILPHAEVLKKELLKKYQDEHEGYLAQVEALRKQAEEQRQRALEEQQRLERERSKVGIGGGAPPSYAASTGPSTVSNPNTYSSTSGPYVPPVGGPMQPSAPVADTWPYNDYSLLDPTGESSTPQSSMGGTTPSIDRSTKPNRFLTPISSGLRPLVVPADLPGTFLRLANSNTAKNVETCGFLTGKISKEKLVVTDLIIPKQTGTADTCTTLDESEIFALQDQYNLITFGWIHTHPSQTAFLSSVDMHTHYSYQIMMPEAIAIVCAPKHNQTGIFSLSPNEGMEEIGSCNLNGFHPHKSTGLFVEATHCTLDSTVHIKVHDLRR